MGNIHTVGPNEALIVSGKLEKHSNFKAKVPAINVKKKHDLLTR